jgi:hypothetical protein
MDLPLRDHLRLRTNDVQEVRSALNAWRPTDVEVTDGPPTVNFVLNAVSLAWMSVSAMTFGAAVETRTEKFDLYAVFLPLSGRCAVYTPDQKAILRPGHTAVLSAPGTVVSQWSPDSKMVIFTFDAPGLEGRAAEMIQANLDEPIRFDLPLHTGFGPGLYLERDVMMPIVRRLERAENPSMNRDIVERYPYRVMTELLKSQPNNFSSRML